MPKQKGISIVCVKPYKSEKTAALRLKIDEVDNIFNMLDNRINELLELESNFYKKKDLTVIKDFINNTNKAFDILYNKE